jgi:hypothetical protein
MVNSPWPELLGYALAIGFSPLHLALLLLLLLGPHPLRRGGFLVLSWVLMSALVIGLLLGVGHGLVLTMEKGTSHRTGLDLLAAGAFFALGVQTLRPRPAGADASPEWSQQLDRLLQMPLPLLLLISAALQVAAPDDLFLYAKAAGALFQPGWNGMQDAGWSMAYGALTSLLLLVPLLACIVVGQQRLEPTLGAMKGVLDRYGQLLVGAICLALALVVGWQGLEGLQITQASTASLLG